MLAPSLRTSIDQVNNGRPRLPPPAGALTNATFPICATDPLCRRCHCSRPPLFLLENGWPVAPRVRTPQS
jgi:hypothetical protein